MSMPGSSFAYWLLLYSLMACDTSHYGMSWPVWCLSHCFELWTEDRPPGVLEEIRGPQFFWYTSQLRDADRLTFGMGRLGISLTGSPGASRWGPRLFRAAGGGRVQPRSASLRPAGQGRTVILKVEDRTRALAQSSGCDNVVHVKSHRSCHDQCDESFKDYL